MSSPTLQSFCCAKNFTEVYYITAEHPAIGDFNRHYNIVCSVSSFISVCGALYQLVGRCPCQIQKVSEQNSGVTGKSYRIAAHSSEHIISWLSVSDLLAAAGIFMRSITWLVDVDFVADLAERSSHFSRASLLCAVLAAWIQYFYITTYMWTLVYAVDVYRRVTNKSRRLVVYHVLVWVLSAALCTEGLLLLYFPSIYRCQDGLRYNLPHYLASYVPMTIVMIVNPVLYALTTSKVESNLIGSLGKFTDSERHKVRATRDRFLQVMFVFYACWLPNLINGALLPVESSNKWVVTQCFWFVMAILNPMQALLNSVVYRGAGGSRQHSCCTPGGCTCACSRCCGGASGAGPVGGEVPVYHQEQVQRGREEEVHTGAGSQGLGARLQVQVTAQVAPATPGGNEDENTPLMRAPHR